MTDRRHRPWRDNLEAVTVALLVAVLFKYFVVEAYKIPTGSMQPTLFGWENEEGGGVFDRILVDKVSYHWRDPERFEVVVFRYPLDRSKNLIKRIWGLPGERLRIRYGDVWRRRSNTEAWTILRRPESVMRTGWLDLESAERWSFGPSPDIWSEEGADLVATSEGAASFPSGVSSVRDDYTDGYPPKLAALVAGQRALPGGSRNVGDLRVTASLVATAGCEQVRLRLREGSRNYTAAFPGPAAPANARPTLTLSDGTHRVDPASLEADAPLRLQAGRGFEVSLQNLDDRVTLRWPEGELALEVPTASDQRSGVVLETRGGGAAFRDLRLSRDIYYISDDAIQDTFEVPAGQFMMLGDNTLSSSDSRKWQLIGFRVDAPPYDGAELRGSEIASLNPAERNPRKVEGEDGEQWTFFRDEFGERHHFPSRAAVRLTPLPASFVPREMIAGRALLVFWPYVPKLDVYRLRWIR